MNYRRRRASAAIVAMAGALAAPAVLAGSAARRAAEGTPSAAGARRRPPLSLIKPRKLDTDAVVGLIAPGGVVDDITLQQCVSNLESLGFTVKLGANIRAARGGYAGTVAQRVDDLHAMFLDREVKAIWAARGGSGCTALLPHIQYGLIRRHPKILVGYSDITALHLALFRHAGIVTFHGPVAWSTLSEYSYDHLLAVLMQPQRTFAITMSAENAERAAAEPQFALRTLRPGVAEGRLVGGNLSVLAALVGTPYAAEFRERLLFLEDIGEAPYRIDRMLTQLQQSQGLRHAAGAMLGVFQHRAVIAGEASLTLNEVLDDHFAGLSIPSVYGFSFGHVAHQFTIPVGVRARLDTEAQTLTLLESAVLEG
ncbi:MAG: LD-carboxypeptidase [Betaproteobacteria bacterium]